MAQKLIDITGSKYGKLKVVEYVGNQKWKCRCDCGNITYASGTSLRRGDKTSCGCDRKTRFRDLTGKKYGKLTVLGRDFSKKSDRIHWICQCDCGNIISVLGSNLGRNTNSCGCLKKENTSKVTHGKRKTKIYGVWCSMKSRCFNSNSKSYKDYGARGITVCEDWRWNFKTFYDWSIKNGYKEGLQIDRIDNDKSYSPENCRWITRKENMNNTSKNVFITYKNEKHTLSEWSDIVGTPERLISQRLKNGWNEHDALFGKNGTKSS